MTATTLATLTAWLTTQPAPEDRDNPDIDGEDAAAQRRGDYDSEQAQEWLARRNSP